jgi:cbb3-type cytochrome c oxidase subunit II
MRRMETAAAVMLSAGMGLFGLAGFLAGYLPVSHLARIEYSSLDKIAPIPSPDFIELSKRYPAAFKAAFGEPTKESFHTALRIGRDRYIAEACWHCHSQFVRPVSNEDQRFGKVSWAAEYRNEMFLPHLFGTRRVGPDLIRESGRHGNDWHAAHFMDPTLVSPASVMPRYTWFFDGETPNKTGLAMITYMQWLGSWATPEALAAQQSSKEANHE